MFEGFNIWIFLSGIPLGLAVAAIVMMINRRLMKKKRMFDERYTTIQRQGRSAAWLVTTVAILIAWMTAIIVEGPHLAFFLITGIWVVHMLAYIVTTAVAANNN